MKVSKLHIKKGAVIFFIMVFAFLLCSVNNGAMADNLTGRSESSAGKTIAKKYKVRVLATFPHDRHSYTQGLFFNKGVMYESAGQYGESSFRIVDYKTGSLKKRWNFNAKYFLEGSCIFGNNIYILTWQEHSCFVYSADKFKKVGVASYPTEGWGLTTDGKEMIMSDGSSTLYFMDPASFYCTRRINVTLNGAPLKWINELEYIDGLVWANVYETDKMVMIDPKTGIVKAELDCSGILSASLKKADTDVLNGIAYNPLDGGIYITGKYWPRLFRIANPLR